MRTDLDTTAADGRECQECGEDAVAMVIVGGQPMTLCGACLSDRTDLCPNCNQREWIDTMTRVYGTSTLFCADCSKALIGVVAGREHEARVDDSKGGR